MQATGEAADFAGEVLEFLGRKILPCLGASGVGGDAGWRVAFVGGRSGGFVGGGEDLLLAGSREGEPWGAARTLGQGGRRWGKTVLIRRDEHTPRRTTAGPANRFLASAGWPRSSRS